MHKRRTDLALEQHELSCARSAADTVEGVSLRRRRSGGYVVTEVRVKTPEGARAIERPVGSYITMDVSSYWRREEGYFPRAVQALSKELRALLPAQCGAALVVGLGNDAVTPDALGPQTVSHVFVTRHLVGSMPREFGSLCSVSAVAAGVLGTTGVEAAELTGALVHRTKPQAVIAVDALASRRMERLCATVQLSDSGISPGSGVGNHRFTLSRETLGVPVISIGVPTVVEAATLAADLLEDAGASIPPQLGEGRESALFVTPRDIDEQVRELARVIGYAIDLALQPSLDLDTLTGLMV